MSLSLELSSDHLSTEDDSDALISFVRDLSVVSMLNNDMTVNTLASPVLFVKNVNIASISQIILS